MGHGIEVEDRGYVWGDTWHQLPQYVQLDRPVTTEEAKLVLNYPLKRIQLAQVGTGLPVEAYCIVRSDTGRVLVPHVGPRFKPMDNVLLVDVIESRLLAQNPELVIESVGTLFGGATAFLNIVLEKYHIKGDDSETLTRLLYANPLGSGGYKVGVHNIRVVCNNTLRMAKAQAAANETLTMIPHTESAAQRIADTLFDMSRILGASLEFRTSVESLVDMPIRDKNELDKLLELLFPRPDGDEPDSDDKSDALSHAEKLQNRVAAIFDAGVEGIEPQYQRTRYSLLQACTYIVDHPEVLRNGVDEAYVIWDGIVGDRAVKKEHFLTVLLTAG